jgi:hypothetical protein
MTHEWRERLTAFWVGLSFVAVATLLGGIWP